MNGGEVHPKSPEWWKASDGLWYPPEAHPNSQYQQLVRAGQQRQAERSDFRRAMNAGFGIGCGLMAFFFVAFIALVVLLALLL